MTNYVEKWGENGPIDGFFCHACLDNKSIVESSPDPRYCHGCYDVLLEEARMDKSWRKATWKPVSTDAINLLTDESEDGKGTVGTRGHTRILSTVKQDRNTVDIIKPKETNRGRKRIVLPESIIFSLADEGMGSKTIAARLRDQGITANYRTVARILQRRANHAQG
jgi:hypothetical protein